MSNFKKYSWIHPLDVMKSLEKREEHIVFLYSGSDDNSEYSYIAYDVSESLKGDSFDLIENKFSSKKNVNKFKDMWFGYFGYGLRDNLENLKRDKPSYIEIPDFWMIKFKKIIVFDHKNKEIIPYGDVEYFSDLVKVIEAEKFISEVPKTVPEISFIESNMTSSEYLDKVLKIKKSIVEGDIYEVNLTRKFYGEFLDSPDFFSIFENLNYYSPSSYSAFLKLGDYSIISSSPERFLKVDSSGNINICPIKGTSPRFKNKDMDIESFKSLQNSVKDKAENLMIVDLSRNDLSKCCESGSIRVENLFKIKSYAFVHHMVSEIYGKKRGDVSVIDLIKCCFPPGSMTGAPKVNAMKIASVHEQIERGVYSGALGYISEEGSLDLSVVIRTLVIHKRRFEFQGGGAIVYDSEPEKEQEEIKFKLEAVFKSVGLKEQDIDKLL